MTSITVSIKLLFQTYSALTDDNNDSIDHLPGCVVVKLTTPCRGLCPKFINQSINGFLLTSVCAHSYSFNHVSDF